MILLLSLNELLELFYYGEIKNEFINKNSLLFFLSNNLEL